MYPKKKGKFSENLSHLTQGPMQTYDWYMSILDRKGNTNGATCQRDAENDLMGAKGMWRYGPLSDENN